MHLESSDEEMQNSITSCKLKFSSKLRKRAPVFITDFSNGRIVTSDRNKLKFESFKSDKDSDKINYEVKRNLMANNGRLDYMGSSATKAPFRYFVGVLCKRTGKMKLYDSVLFHMKPVLQQNMKLDSMQASTEPTSKTYSEGLNDLTLNFGSKTKQRALNSRMRHIVNLPMDESLPLDESATPKLSLSENITSSISYIPSKNHDALSPAEVYDINDIITQQVDHVLHDEAESMLNASEEEREVKWKAFCKYVHVHLERGGTDLIKLKYLIYYNYLVSFQHLGFSDIRKRDPAPNIPEPLKEILLDTFTVSSTTERGRSSRGLPQHMKDKLLAYILVLALFIDGFCVDSTLVLNDLRNVSLIKFQKISQALGCHVRNQKDGQDSKFTVLKLPLYVLTQRSGKKSFLK